MTDIQNNTLEQNEIDSLLDNKYLSYDEELWLNTSNGIVAQKDNFIIFKTDNQLVLDLEIISLIVSDISIINNSKKFTVLAYEISLGNFLRKIQYYLEIDNWNRIISEFLASINYKTLQAILKYTEEKDNKLSNDILKNYNSIDYILNLDDKSIQSILRDIDMRDLVNALTNASEAILDKIKKNMSKNARKYYDEEKSYAKNDESYEFESKRRIINITKRLAESGEIIYK